MVIRLLPGQLPYLEVQHDTIYATQPAAKMQAVLTRGKNDPFLLYAGGYLSRLTVAIEYCAIREGAFRLSLR